MHKLCHINYFFNNFFFHSQSQPLNFENFSKKIIYLNFNFGVLHDIQNKTSSCMPLKLTHTHLTHS